MHVQTEINCAYCSKLFELVCNEEDVPEQPADPDKHHIICDACYMLLVEPEGHA